MSDQHHYPQPPPVSPPVEDQTGEQVGRSADPGSVVEAAVAQSEALRIQGEIASASYAGTQPPRILRDLSPFGR